MIFIITTQNVAMLEILRFLKVYATVSAFHLLPAHGKWYIRDTKLHHPSPTTNPLAQPPSTASVSYLCVLF